MFLSRVVDRIKSGTKKELFQIILIIITIKLWLFLLASISYPLIVGRSGADSIVGFTVDIWSRWDAINYQRLAQHWYLPTGDERNLIVYYPLLPMLTRAASYLTNNIKSASLIVANVSALAGLWLFYVLARLDYKKPQALAALMALLLFPTSYFFNAPYTEGLSLLTVAAALYAARRQKWFLASLSGGIASLTRVTSLAVLPALLVEFYLQWRSKRSLWPQAIYLILIPVFFSWYLYLNYSVLGDPLAFRAIISDHWYKSFAWPWEGLMRTWQQTGQFPLTSHTITMGWGELIASVFLIIMSILSIKLLRPSYTVFVIAVTCLVLSTSYLMSTPRYVLSAFPLFLIFSTINHNSWWFRLGLIFSIMLLSLFTIQYTRGWWAF